MLYMARPVIQSHCAQLISDMGSGGVKNLACFYQSDIVPKTYFEVETLYKELCLKSESEAGL